MKKFRIFLGLLLMVFSLVVIASCDKEEQPSDKPQEVELSDAILAREGYSYHYVGGYEGSWTTTEKNLMEATSLKAVGQLDDNLGKKLAAKAPKYLYMAEITMGASGAGWTSFAMENGKRMKLDGTFTVKVILGQYDDEDENYTIQQWIPDPKTAHIEALTDNLFVPIWQEALDDNGFSWSDNPVVLSGAGEYYLIIADYGKVSDADNAGYGFALIKKADVEGDGTVEEKVEEAFVPAEPSDFEGYSLIGAFGGHNWDFDLDLTEADGKWSVEVELAADDQVKVRKDHDWGTSYGFEALSSSEGLAEAGGNVKIVEAGTYLVEFDGEHLTFTKK